MKKVKRAINYVAGRRKQQSYGHLPMAIPDAELPEITLPRWLTSFAWLRTPRELKSELDHIGALMGNRDQAMAYNLHYEITGMGCISAAIPDKRQKKYSAYRRLEWEVGFAPRFSCMPLFGTEACVRFTPGYVGALSGRTADWHISMNYAPDSYDINYRGLPVSWILRHALAMGRSYQATINWLKKQTVVKRAFVLITGEKRAAWLTLDTSCSYIESEVEWPKELVVGNEYDEVWFDPDEWKGIKPQTWGDWKQDGNPYQAGSEDAWVLDQYITRI